ncbi:MAG: hypothetical protein IPO81_08795 [Kouleothrix sp.]|nr:hypothetical protein [Kouleothrix sp.]
MSGLTTTTGEPVAAESGGDDYEMEDEVDVRIDQSKKPIDALVYNHLLVIEKGLPRRPGRGWHTGAHKLRRRERPGRGCREGRPRRS